MGHIIPTKLHRFPTSSLQDFVRTDRHTDRRRQKQYLLAVIKCWFWFGLHTADAFMNYLYTNPSFQHSRFILLTVLSAGNVTYPSGNCCAFVSSLWGRAYRERRTASITISLVATWFPSPCLCWNLEWWLVSQHVKFKLSTMLTTDTLLNCAIQNRSV